MTEIIHSTLKVMFVCAIIVLCFWLFKHRTRATIETGDKSMDATNFPEGGYGVDTSIASITDLKSGDFVAFRTPSDNVPMRIARIIGIEGNRVEVSTKAVLVNGAPVVGKINTGTWTMPETKVPRGCAYLLVDDTFMGLDSRQLGPIPFVSIVGTVKPSH